MCVCVCSLCTPLSHSLILSIYLTHLYLSLTSGTPATHSNRVGQSSLHIAALWGNDLALKALLSHIPKGSMDLNIKNKIGGSTPLHSAANSNKKLKGRMECVRVRGEKKRRTYPTHHSPLSRRVFLVFHRLSFSSSSFVFLVFHRLSFSSSIVCPV